MRLPLRRSLSAAAGLLLSACMPLVSHGPRVEPGLWTGSTSGLGLGPGLDAEVETAFGGYAVRPPNGFFARYGWTGGEGTVPGFLVGLHLPFPIPLSVVHPELDLYAQVSPREGPLQMGSGLLAAPSYLMPYAQLGTDVGGASWHTTQGLAVFGYRGGGPRAVLWMPALVWRRPGRPDPEDPARPRPATQYYLQAAFGRESVGGRDEKVGRVMIGIAREAPGIPRLPGLR